MHRIAGFPALSRRQPRSDRGRRLCACLSGPRRGGRRHARLPAARPASRRDRDRRLRRHAGLPSRGGRAAGGRAARAHSVGT
ncbi:MAG: hypothetical protein CVT84_11750 [Alphaproteobacteria bacterium HGW-Alphaproteobacteria-6]|nr:MAG: hypothetical protein CVT84_11750 [Alphaproteobacteria bacterium HGW-Alphaproteobacteria-6]